MKQKHADSPSAFLAAAMAVTGAAMLLCPLIGQNTEMNRSAAEYDDLRVQLKSEESAQATDAHAQKAARKPAEDMAIIVEDLIKVLDRVGNDLRRGRYPEKAQGTKVASLLRAVAENLEA